MNDDILLTPAAAEPAVFTDAAAAVECLEAFYATATTYLGEAFTNAVTNGKPHARVRAYYPEVRLTVTSHDKIDSRLSFGHVSHPGTYSTTITRPQFCEILSATARATRSTTPPAG